MLSCWRRACLEVLVRHPAASCARRKLSISPVLYYAASRSATVKMEDYDCDVIRCALVTLFLRIDYNLYISGISLSLLTSVYSFFASCSLC